MVDCLRFGEFELDVAAYDLRRGGQRVKLEKIPMEVLIQLARSAGRLVGREELHAALWKADVFIEHDAAINTAIRKVRRALADDPNTPRFIETIVGKGYRFIAPVERRGRAGVGSSGRRRTFPSYVLTRGKKEFALRSGENLIGRDPAAPVYLDHASVSRRHARISITPGGAVLEDLRSRNGTFVDGRRIEAPTGIGHGAIIGLGPIALTFVVLSGPASTAPLTSS